VQFGIRLGQQVPIEYIGVMEIILGIFLLIYIRKKAKWYQIKVANSVVSIFISVGTIFILAGLKVFTVSTFFILLILAGIIHFTFFIIFSNKANQYRTFKEELKSDEAMEKLKSGCVVYLLITVIIIIVAIIIKLIH
jgi:hypothetical protein